MPGIWKSVCKGGFAVVVAVVAVVVVVVVIVVFAVVPSLSSFLSFIGIDSGLFLLSVVIERKLCSGF
jgi:hypothetical protein